MTCADCGAEVHMHWGRGAVLVGSLADAARDNRVGDQFVCEVHACS